MLFVHAPVAGRLVVLQGAGDYGHGEERRYEYVVEGKARRPRGRLPRKLCGGRVEDRRGPSLEEELRYCYHSSPLSLGVSATVVRFNAFTWCTL